MSYSRLDAACGKLIKGSAGCYYFQETFGDDTEISGGYFLQKKIAVRNCKAKVMDIFRNYSIAVEYLHMRDFISKLP